MTTNTPARFVDTDALEAIDALYRRRHAIAENIAAAAMAHELNAATQRRNKPTKRTRPRVVAVILPSSTPAARAAATQHTHADLLAVA